MLPLAVLSFFPLCLTLSATVSAAPLAPGDGLSKRAFDNARITFYDVSAGVTACGGTFSNSDFVVALNSQQFGTGFPGPNCGRSIAITANGKTVNAQIEDNCPGCPFGGLDLTEGLFEQFASLDVGVITGSWDFI